MHRVYGTPRTITSIKYFKKQHRTARMWKELNFNEKSDLAQLVFNYKSMGLHQGLHSSKTDITTCIVCLNISKKLSSD